MPSFSAAPLTSAQPVALLRVPARARVRHVLRFDGSASYETDGTIVSYRWSFGDGKSGSGPRPSHTYRRAGHYTVRLTVADAVGRTATASHRISVSR